MDIKYDNLTKYLKDSNVDEITITYEELKQIIGGLTNSLLKYGRTFFNNNSLRNNYFKYWYNAGYLAFPDIKNQIVTFKKGVEPEHRERANIQVKELSYEELDVNEILKVDKEVQESPNYGKENLIINKVLTQFPKNDDLNVIAMKIAVIDVTNSTQISKYKKVISLYDIAEIILNIKDFDTRVENGDEELVNEIAKATKEKGINLFSFASKYCCYHNYEIYHKNDYSIYDSIIRDNLPNYIKGITKRTIVNYKENIDYKKFNDLIGHLIEYNNIKIPIRRQLDHYIWWKGKNEI